MALFMTGCSTVRLVDSDVTAFYNWNGRAARAGTPYRFERLPSQQAVGSQQDLVEGLARTRIGQSGDGTQLAGRALQRSGGGQHPDG
jgi:hypothetical protein